jgi:antitoxin ParD1/3/4
MPTRNVVITAHQAELIDRLVASGRYQNASEVLRAGLRAVEQDEAEHEAKLAVLRAAVQVGVDAIEAGDYIDFESPEEMRRHLRMIADKAIERAGK